MVPALFHLWQLLQSRPRPISTLRGSAISSIRTNHPHAEGRKWELLLDITTIRQRKSTQARAAQKPASEWRPTPLLQTVIAQCWMQTIPWRLSKPQEQRLQGCPGEALLVWNGHVRSYTLMESGECEPTLVKIQPWKSGAAPSLSSQPNRTPVLTSRTHGPFDRTNSDRILS